MILHCMLHRSCMPVNAVHCNRVQQRALPRKAMQGNAVISALALILGKVRLYQGQWIAVQLLEEQVHWSTAAPRKHIGNKQGPQWLQLNNKLSSSSA